MTIRIPYGGGIGAVEHHSESPEAYFAHTAGLRIVTCSHARDGYQMLRQAITCDDPVIFLEPKRRYWDKAELGDVGEGLFQSRVVRAGGDVTVVCYGPMVRTCLEAAGLAHEEDGLSLEVIDLRSLSRWTWGRCSTRWLAQAGRSWSTRRQSSADWARKLHRASARSASSVWKRRCCGSVRHTLLPAVQTRTPLPA